MSNFLTGDFDAVAQLSRGTVNRLLATTHQNKKGYSKKPGIKGYHVTQSMLNKFEVVIHECAAHPHYSKNGNGSLPS